MTIMLPQLPYSKDALSPHISVETLDYHYSKHHQAYVTKVNELIKGTEWESEKLEDIIKGSKGAIYNNGAQVWNHSFYWNCLCPKGGGEPKGTVAESITKYFGEFSKFKTEFTNAAATHFGSGWTWLVKDQKGALSIESTPNAENPMRANKKPLLTCDIWEHAYYIDYRNARPKYIDAFWELVNWDYVTKNLRD